ncbi:hypothetical protein Golomagni_06621 [Golovinomyces magnicellulatus]|nr:hypothetical protein Golomagni_06621 [Golovinomyces magnicellulatus]
MTFDWAHDYCLACDKQIQVDSAAYCSEACRLAELEKTSTASSQVSSPGLAPPTSWAAPTRAPSVRQSRFYLSPAYDFSNAQPYGTTPAAKSLFEYYTKPAQPTAHVAARTLTPSSSHSSLCSMQSTSSAGDGGVSAKAKKELQAYAVSFEQVRLQRRRSY